MFTPVSQNCDFKSFPVLFFVMEIIEKLLIHEEWLRFLEYKIQGGHLPREEEQRLTEFVNNKEYLTVAQKLNDGGFFSLPEAVQLNKRFSEKKRTVFIFPEEENFVQKMIAYQLLNYDYLFCGNLYSFRRDMGVKKAVSRLVFAKNINKMYSYKLDISDYFNSVNSSLLLPKLKTALEDDGKLYAVIENMLTNEFALVEGEKVKIKKGVLAGSPISGFSANFFITELDEYFENNGVLYARYSDDIIFFAESEEELAEYINYTLEFLHNAGLSVNEKKVVFTKPEEEWNFLGFKYDNGTIDISEASKKKLKKKMKRKARALVRWKKRKNADADRAVRAFIKYFDRKFYNNYANNEITWCRWYFPIITTKNGLKEIDEYMQQCIRYIATEKHNKTQYNYTYKKMKEAGYTTLVNNYYKFRENNKNA